MPSLTITQVVNGVTPQTEYIELKVDPDLEETINVRGYAIIDNTFNGAGRTNIFRHIFAFPSHEVNPGDIIRVFSLRQNPISYAANNIMIHEFSWNSNAPIWNNRPGEQALLINYRVLQRYILR